MDEAQNYFSHPADGSIHNFGMAVDLSLLNENGEALDMGTDFDHFGELAHPLNDSLNLSRGKLSLNQVAHRRLLKAVMEGAGYIGVNHEWWHFNAGTKEHIRTQYQLIE